MCSSAGSSKKILLLSAVLLFGFVSGGRFVFRDVQCKVHDPKLAGIIYCRFERNQQNVSALSVRFRNSGAWCNKTTNVMKYMRKVSATRYVNFVTPLKFDLCKFFSDEYNMLLKISFDALRQYSNMNHSCPITESELYVDKFPIDDRMLAWIPIRKGDYMVSFSSMLSDVPIVVVNVYMRQQNLS